MIYAISYVLIGLVCMLGDRLVDGWLWPTEEHRVDLYILAAWPVFLLVVVLVLLVMAFERIRDAIVSGGRQ